MTAPSSWSLEAESSKSLGKKISIILFPTLSFVIHNEKLVYIIKVDDVNVTLKVN